MVIIRIYVAALWKCCWWYHSKNFFPCAAGAIVTIAGGMSKQVVGG